MSLAPALLQRMPPRLKRAASKRAAGAFDHARADQQPDGAVARIAHPAAVVHEVADGLVGGRLAGVPAQFVRHVLDASFGERRADLLRPRPAPPRAGAVHGAPDLLQPLAGVPDVDDAVGVREQFRDCVPDPLRAVPDHHLPLRRREPEPPCGTPPPSPPASSPAGRPPPCRRPAAPSARPCRPDCSTGASASPGADRSHAAISRPACFAVRSAHFAVAQTPACRPRLSAAFAKLFSDASSASARSAAGVSRTPTTPPRLAQLPSARSLAGRLPYFST